MRNIDDVMAHEAEQQDVVEGILKSLHATIEDDYLQEFDSLSAVCMEGLNTEDCLAFLEGLCDDSITSHIVTPLKDFTADEFERKHLLVQVVRKLLDPVLAAHEQNYLHATISASTT